MAESLDLMLTNQYKQYRTKVAQEQRKVSFDFKPTVFRDLIGRVTPHAMWMIHEQYEIVRKETRDNPMPPCTGVYEKTMGLPCKHVIKARMEQVSGNLGRIQLEDIHPHWRFIKPPSDHRTGLSDLSTSDIPLIETALAVQIYDDDERCDDRQLPAIEEMLRQKEHTNNDNLNPPPQSHDPEQAGLDDVISDAELQDVNEPQKVKAKGRPPGSTNKKGTMTRAEKKAVKSTKRDPSGFEHTEAAVRASRARGRGKGAGTRGRCGGAGTGRRSTKARQTSRERREAEDEEDEVLLASLKADVAEGKAYFAKKKAEAAQREDTRRQENAVMNAAMQDVMNVNDIDEMKRLLVKDDERKARRSVEDAQHQKIIEHDKIITISSDEEQSEVMEVDSDDEYAPESSSGLDMNMTL